MSAGPETENVGVIVPLSSSHSLTHIHTYIYRDTHTHTGLRRSMWASYHGRSARCRGPTRGEDQLPRLLLLEHQRLARKLCIRA